MYSDFSDRVLNNSSSLRFAPFRMTNALNPPCEGGEKNSKLITPKAMNKKEIIQKIIQIAITILTAIATTLGTTSCIDLMR